MAKPTTYRGIPYTLVKGSSLRDSDMTTWYGIALLNGRTEVVCEIHNSGIRYTLFTSPPENPWD